MRHIGALAGGLSTDQTSLTCWPCLRNAGPDYAMMDADFTRTRFHLCPADAFSCLLKIMIIASGGERSRSSNLTSGDHAGALSPYWRPAHTCRIHSFSSTRVSSG